MALRNLTFWWLISFKKNSLEYIRMKFLRKDLRFWNDILSCECYVRKKSKDEVLTWTIPAPSVIQLLMISPVIWQIKEIDKYIYKNKTWVKYAEYKGNRKNLKVIYRTQVKPSSVTSRMLTFWNPVKR